MLSDVTHSKIWLLLFVDPCWVIRDTDATLSDRLGAALLDETNSGICCPDELFVYSYGAVGKYF